MFRDSEPIGAPRDPSESIIRNSLGYLVTGWWNNPEDLRGNMAQIFDGSSCVAAIHRATTTGEDDPSALLIRVFTQEDSSGAHEYLFDTKQGSVQALSGPYADVLDSKDAASELAKTIQDLANNNLDRDLKAGITIDYKWSD